MRLESITGNALGVCIVVLEKSIGARGEENTRSRGVAGEGSVCLCICLRGGGTSIPEPVLIEGDGFGLNLAMSVSASCVRPCLSKAVASPGYR